SAMRVTRTMTVDGTFVDARQNGGSARLVISSAPRGIVAPALRSRAAAWIPARHFHSALSGRRYTRAVAACTTVRRPVQFSGLGMLTILTVDLDRGLYASDSKALMADAEIVYGSPHSLYVATERWIDPSTAVDRLPTNQTTVIDRFDATDPRTTTFVASGEVPGYLLNQFSLSEHNGYLRAASTSRPIWWFGRPRSTSQSYVTVLAQQGPVLAPVGQVDGLGVGQQIRSVRFVRNAGYVVTFRQIDPLYTLDLSAPTAPRVAGQLELQGYSAYLHPLSPGRLLGVGQDVNPSGSEPSGVQLELFDVSRPSSPRLLARQTLGQGSSSSVNFDHHAFLYWPPTKLAMLPVEIYPDSSGTAPGSIPPGASGSGTASSPPSGPATADSSGSSFVGAIGYHVDGGISELGRVSHDASSGYPPAIQRSLVVGPHVFTISDTGVMASTLSTLAREGFVAFPAPPPPPNPQPAPAPGGPPQPAPAARPAPSAHG
ncbi:MAG TPA: beta-propeller domain-containing protein, partial [Solirubrobacteraceae bacterium]|nr:beta-propeller domain-containing protein [Solirubrobacteraceae bacterium]